VVNLMWMKVGSVARFLSGNYTSVVSANPAVATAAVGPLGATITAVAAGDTSIVAIGTNGQVFVVPVTVAVS